jgi:23S rRNA (cytidine1920-2'-O)/16S rRNA (cytidine1409-2'-O)-methyltransferase
MAIESRSISRAADKLAYALDYFGVVADGRVAADLGCGAGGFTAELLKRGVVKVYAVDTGYGQFAWSLRQDPRVILKERTNALYADLPEKMDLIAIDVGWTRQRMILPAALKLLKKDGIIISLLKPHYEANARYAAKRRGELSPAECAEIARLAIADLTKAGIFIKGYISSPLAGVKGKNREYLLLIVQQKNI